MLPEALSVNHESRVEALRHFAIVLRENFPDQDNQEKQQHPTCLNVSKDFAYFSAAAMEDWGRFFWGWIRDIKGAQPSSGAKIIDDIRVLHVRHFEWNEEIKAGYTDNLKFEKTHGLEEVLLGGILQFSGLRKVVFTGCDVMMREMSKEIEASAKEFIQEFLEGHKHMFASKEAPEIVVQGWKALLKPEDEEESKLPVHKEPRMVLIKYSSSKCTFSGAQTTYC